MSYALCGICAAWKYSCSSAKGAALHLVWPTQIFHSFILQLTVARIYWISTKFEATGRRYTFPRNWIWIRSLKQRKLTDLLYHIVRTMHYVFKDQPFPVCCMKNIDLLYSFSIDETAASNRMYPVPYTLLYIQYECITHVFVSEHRDQILHKIKNTSN